MLSIGRLAKENGISVRMLRYYDEKGLLMPVYRDNAGIRYYEDDAAEKLRMIRTMLSFGFSVDEIHDQMVEEKLDPTQAKDLLLEQKKDLIRQKERLERQIQALDDTMSNGFDAWQDWQQITETLCQNYVDSHVLRLHMNGHRTDTPFYQHFGSPISPWTKWLFEPVRFDSKNLKMCEVNACYIDLWKILEDRRPAGELDLYYDPRVQPGTASLEKEDLTVRWQPVAALAEHPEEYDLVINDHLSFYGNAWKAGLDACYKALKPGGRFYCTQPDPESRRLLNDWATYINPMNYYRQAGLAADRRFSFLKEYLPGLYRSVQFHERFRTIRMDDASVILEDLKEKSGYDKSDAAMRKRYAHVENQVHRLLKKQGHIETESRYYLIEAVK